MQKTLVEHINKKAKGNSPVGRTCRCPHCNQHDAHIYLKDQRNAWSAKSYWINCYACGYDAPLH